MRQAEKSFPPGRSYRRSGVLLSQGGNITRYFQLCVKPPIEHEEKTESRGLQNCRFPSQVVVCAPGGGPLPVSGIGEGLAQLGQIAVSRIIVAIKTEVRLLVRLRPASRREGQ